ncbi:hypothetical protein F4811DRAFT_570655 [Daldinia bambusicola]|nr:hypothetical protein F4811DRAFT_570655 [Daldinia bambusicola]
MTNLIEPSRQFDPEGDVLLTLHNPNAPFAVWDRNWPHEAHSSVPEQDNTESSSPDLPKLEQGSLASEQPPNSTNKIQFLVSSRHLRLASKFFNALFRGPWKETASKSPDGLWCVDAHNWNETAMLRLMAFAVLVDYYKCHEAVLPWSNKWIDNEWNPNEWDVENLDLYDLWEDEFILWILISQVFEKKDIFEKITRLAMIICPGELPTLGLPIVATAEAFDVRRKKLLDRAFNSLYNLLSRLRTGKAGCTPQCSSMMLGALCIELHRKGIMDDQWRCLGYPYAGHSVQSMIELVESFKVPEWMYTTSRIAHSCKLKDDIALNVKDVKGLKLHDII